MIAGKGVKPDYNCCESNPDLDLSDIEDDFGIKIPDGDMKKIDGTFDTLVLCIASQRGSTS